MSATRAAAVLWAILCAACATRQRHQDDFIRRYVELAAALGERDPASLDYYYGPEDWVAEARSHPPTFAEIRKRALDLAGQVPSPSERLVLQLRAIAGRADILMGLRPSFDEEARALFGVTVPASDKACQGTPSLAAHGAVPLFCDQTAKIRVEIDRLLPGPGPLLERYAAFDKRFLIPSERVPAVIDRAIQGCRERSAPHLQLPPGEEVKLEYVTNRAWNAFSRYQGNFHSLIQINADFSLTVDRALRLACHEGYPGHHAYNSLQDALLVRGERQLEWMVQPAFSPQSLVSEAMATYAPDLAFSPDERLQFERDVLFPLAGLDSRDIGLYLRVTQLVDKLDRAEPLIARDYLDGKLEYVRAASALEHQALMAHTDATLKYLNEYRTYMLTYTLGKDMVQSCFDREWSSGNKIADRWRLFIAIVTRRVPVSECSH